MEIINEKDYQNIKKIMNKESDFFTEEEIKKFDNFLTTFYMEKIEKIENIEWKIKNKK